MSRDRRPIPDPSGDQRLPYCIVRPIRAGVTALIMGQIGRIVRVERHQHDLWAVSNQRTDGVERVPGSIWIGQWFMGR